LLSVVQQAYVCGVSTRLVARGLVGVQLVISDAHEGLKNAIAKVLGAPWQRCTVHFLRDCLGHARRDQHGLLAALIRPIFNAENLAAGRDKLSEAVATLEAKLPKVAGVLEAAEDDILAFYAFPADHWRKIRSTNPLERFNREIGRRTDVVGIFPDDRSVIRLASMLAIEQNDEWLVGPALPIRRVDGAAPRGPAPSSKRRGGPRAPTGLSSPTPHRRTWAPPLTPRPGT
jgi:putative transposase